MVATAAFDRCERPTRSTSGRGVLAVLVAFVALSIGSTLAKSAGSPGTVVAFWRFVIGAALWHGVVALRGARHATRRTLEPGAWRAATVPGIAFGINLSCFFTGVTRTPIAHAEFISALTPVLMVPLAALMYKERVPRLVIACGAVAFVGVALILGQAPAKSTSYAGDVLVIGSVVAWIAYLLGAKAARARLDSADFMAVMSTAAAATTLPVSLVAAGGPAALVSLPAKGWLIVALLAVTSGIAAHGLIAWSQQRVPVGTISILQLAQPGIAVLWAATFLGESVQPIQLAGMAVVLLAVATVAAQSS